MATIFGDDNDEKILQKNFPSTTQDSSGQWKMEFQYVLNSSIAFDTDVVPAFNSTVPPEFAIPGVTAGLLLLGKTYSPNEMPGYQNLTLAYTLPSSESTGSPSNPADPPTLEANTVFREVPVENALAPGTDEGLSPGEVSAQHAIGNSTKFAFQVQFIRTEVQTNGSINETELISKVGKRSDPTGLQGVGASYPAAEQNRWLYTSLSINTIPGNNRQVREEWTYDEAGWDAALYAEEGE